MKNIFNGTLKLLVILTVLTFSSCEKDLYDESIKNTKGKINYVTINEVPFLIPSIQKFNNDYKYLSYSEASNKDILNLNLDLDHILEYVKENGLKTYSIVIKKDFEEYEDKYFENLHVFEKDGVYENVIFKYNALDDSIKFDPTTFTGDLELYDINYVYQGVIQYENGEQKCIKMAVGCMNVWWFTDIGEIWIWYECFAGGGGSSTDNGSSGPGNDSGGSYPGSGSSYGGTPSSGGSNPGGTTPTGNDPTLVVHNPIVPNVPVWPDPEGASTFNMARLLKIELNLTTEEQVWLRNNPIITYESYSYVWDILNDENSDNDTTEKTFIKNIIPRLRQNTVFTSIKPFIIEKEIYDAPLDPCFKSVLNKLKNSTNCDISTVLAKLDANNSVYKTVIKNEDFSPVFPAQTERYNPLGFGAPLRYNYIIKVHPAYNSSTKLFKASILLHELIHAYFFSLNDDFYTGNDYTAFDDFPSLYEKFVLKTFPGSMGDAHHHDMALRYVDALGRALQEYNTGSTVPDNAQPDQIYTDLAWGGLGHAPIFNATFPEGSPERTRILNRYACEGTNQQQGNETPIGGNPCNE